MRKRKDKAAARKRGEKTGGKWNPPTKPTKLNGVAVQEHGDVMRSVRPAYSNSSEEFGSQEHSAVMDAILGRDR